MARTPARSDSDLLERLATVFRREGYHGASLATLADACDLQKASLYHRFPRGKRQMAATVLRETEQWLTTEVLAPLSSDAPPLVRARALFAVLAAYYEDGRAACVLNMLGAAQADVDRGADPDASAARNTMRRIVRRWTASVSRLLIEMGHPRERATLRAEQILMLIQGALVLARGTGTTTPFRRAIAIIEEELCVPTD